MVHKEWQYGPAFLSCEEVVVEDGGEGMKGQNGAGGSVVVAIPGARSRGAYNSD